MPATKMKPSRPSRLYSLVAMALISCSPLLVQAKDGGYLNHEAEPQKGDLYAGHFLKKEYAQSRIVNLKDYRDNTWITLEGNIISQTAEKAFVFRDTTGTIPIVVDDSAWHGHEVSSIEVVRIDGRLTRENGHLVMYVGTLSLP